MATELKDYWSDPEPEDPKTTRKVTYVPKDASSADERIKARIEEYLADLDKSSITVSDRSQIKNLARLEIGIEQLTEKLATIGEVESKSAKALSDNLTSLMAQHRQISSLLGIDRKSRSSRGEGEYEQYLPRLHKEALNFVMENAVIILCPHCVKEKAQVKINEGMIIFHFRDNVAWSWTSACPRCRQEFTINQDNWQDFTRAEIDKIGNLDATDEEEN